MKFQISFKSFAVASVAVLFSLSLSAQKAGKPQPKSSQSERIETSKGQADSELAQELGLTPEQQNAFKKADQEYWSKAKATKMAKKDDLQQLREERKRAHRAVLSAEQLKKYDAIQAKKEVKRQEKQAQKAEKKAEKKAVKNKRRATKAENKAIKQELKNQ
jgi:type IV secretory pathway VirB10-like protein